MDSATSDKAPGSEFPEERLLRVFVGAVEKAQSPAEILQILEGAFHIGYRRGLLEGMPPLTPEDVEGIAARFTALAGRMRWLQDSTDRTPLTFGSDEELAVEEERLEDRDPGHGDGRDHG